MVVMLLGEAVCGQRVQYLWSVFSEATDFEESFHVFSLRNIQIRFSACQVHHDVSVIVELNNNY